MKERRTNQQEVMLGCRIKNVTSGPSRSKRVNDRERRTVKRAEKLVWRNDVKAGHFSSVIHRK